MSDNRRTTSRQWLLVFLAAISCIVVVLPGTAAAEFTSTTHSELQAVNLNGATTWGPPKPIVMEGVIINNPWDMLNYSVGDSKQWQWQVYFQAHDDARDFGGTAMYMRRYLPWGGGQEVFTETEWAGQMDRLNFPVYERTGDRVTEPLRYGDRVRVEANAPGGFYNGKYNINTQHMNDPNKLFSITILERDVTPDVANITLADLKDATNFFFDQTRATGCEHYQGSLVHLTGLTWDSGEWGLDKDVFVRQDDLTMPMRLGLDEDLILGDLGARIMSGKAFSLTAILDQEDSLAPYTGGYRLWLTNAGNLTVVPEPSTLVLTLLGGLVGLLVLRRRRAGRVGV